MARGMKDDGGLEAMTRMCVVGAKQLTGQPTTENLMPLIRGTFEVAASSLAPYYCSVLFCFRWGL